MTRISRLLILFFLSAFLLTGCNTTRGVGEDIRDLGGIISHAAS
ncbi:entericidin A/B family lipoprotein [Shimwellia pseudoproteus]|nr:entericidin A/B family lipoprotein [Shimwellia pseudoproteus]MBJ3814051.1 entericidin A/B family lipoprotein [Shimwellia pseudoproteus]